MLLFRLTFTKLRVSVVSDFHANLSQNETKKKSYRKGTRNIMQKSIEIVQSKSKVKNNWLTGCPMIEKTLQNNANLVRFAAEGSLQMQKMIFY